MKKGFLDIKLPMNIVLLFLIMVLTVIFGFAYIGTFFNALGARFEEFVGSGNWMIALSLLIVIVVIISYLEVMKKRGKFFFR
jgi:amino acid permease